MNYKVGDVVTLKNTVNENWDRRMEKFRGQVVVIRVVGAERFHIEDDPLSFIFSFSDVERYATEEELEQIKEKARKKEEELKEKYKHILYNAEDVERVAISVFGEDRVQISGKNENYFEIMIHFPVIDITNSAGDEHTIKDLVVKYGVYIKKSNFEGSNYKADISFRGAKQCFSLKEYESNYVHSHLQRSRGDFGDFCLGSSDYSLILECLKMNLDENSWTMAFLALENYLKWESIEGGPYIQMKEIKYSNNTSPARLEEELSKFIDEIPEHCWEITDGVRVITAHPDLYECINKHSGIRRCRGYSEEEIKGVLKICNENMKGGSPIKWKGKDWWKSVYSDDVKEGNVGTDLIEQYSNLIKTKGLTYIKKYQYERKKQQYKERVFRKVRA